MTQLRTGTSSSKLARGSGPDIMPFNETPEFTKETKIEVLLLIQCQTFLRRLFKLLWDYRMAGWGNFQKMLFSKDGQNSLDWKKALRAIFSSNLTIWCCMLVLGKKHPAEISSSLMKKSMWCPLSSQLQSVQALLPTKSMLCADFVGCLCSCDVNLGVLGGALSYWDRNENFNLR